MTLSARSALLILVAGPPRSGGAELAGLLDLLGVCQQTADSPDQHVAVATENASVAEIQRSVFSVLASDWDDPLPLREEWSESSLIDGVVNSLVTTMSAPGIAGRREVAICEQGVCRVLPLWYRVAERLNRADVTLIPVRHPDHVVESLWLRDGLTHVHGLLVWLESFLAAERASRGHVRCFVSYDELTTNWRDTVKSLSKTIEIVWPLDPDRAGPDIERFLRSVRSSHRTVPSSLSDPNLLQDWVVRAWSAAVLLAKNSGDPDAEGSLDALRSEMTAAFSLPRKLIVEYQSRFSRDLARQATAIGERDRLLEDRAARLAQAAEQLSEYRRQSAAADERAAAYELRVADLSGSLSRLEGDRDLERRDALQLKTALDRMKLERAEAIAKVDQLRKQLGDVRLESEAKLEQTCADVERRKSEYEAANQALRQAVHRADDQLNEVLASTSWRMGAPLRAVVRRVPRGLRGFVKRPLQIGWRVVTPWRNAQRRLIAKAALASAVQTEEPQPPGMPAAEPPVVNVDPHAMHIANLIRNSEFFSEDGYDKQAGARAMGMDPALHYVLYGEAQGLMPSKEFDPVYYGERYPDIAAWGGNRLGHYIERGRAESRQGVSIADTVPFPRDGLDPAKPTVLILVHEASRTGAPILAWNIARVLRSRVNVVAVLLRPGALEESFAKIVDGVVGPPKFEVTNHADGFRFGSRLAVEYNPLYVIANSVETRSLVPGLAVNGVPVVALVHEFSGYTKPRGSLQRLYEQAAEIVFPADIVKRSSEADYPLLKLRHAHVLPQGPSEVPKSDRPKLANSSQQKPGSIREKLRPPGAEDVLLVVGMGFVDWRKGVDLFVGALTALVGREPDASVRFVWVGHGFKVSDALDIASYLAEQVERSGVGDAFAFLDAVENVEDIYAEADVLFLSSRLDPLPNVSIDAALRGIPVVCFAGASGMAEILVSNVATKELVVPHLDAGAAGEAIGKLAANRERLVQLGNAVQELARERFNMQRYVESLDRLGKSAVAGMNQEAEDVRTILAEKCFDSSLYLGALAKSTQLPEAVRMYVAQAAKLDYSRVPISGAYTRRPVAGFNPYTYGSENLQAQSGKGGDPLAHYLRAGRPVGPWVHPVIRVEQPRQDAGEPVDLKVALHAHFHYTDHVGDLLDAVSVNSHSCRLIFTTNSEEKAAEINLATERRSLPVDVLVVENRGRDIGPFLHVLKEVGDRYDVLGHVHGKRSLTTENVDADFGDRWRTFLWQHLVGDYAPMMDLVVREFAGDKTLGLVFPEDPHLIGWEENFEIAQRLAERMKLTRPLPKTLDFPVGTMFWARPDALKPLLTLELDSSEYPGEPLPTDGTILHALERLLPCVVEDLGFHIATTYVPNFVR